MTTFTTDLSAPTVRSTAERLSDGVVAKYIHELTSTAGRPTRRRGAAGRPARRPGSDRVRGDIYLSPRDVNGRDPHCRADGAGPS
jgi:hypothetical protein